MTRRLHGECHCGSIRVMMECSTTPEKLQLRACQCGFCRRHGGLLTSDPDGQLHIEGTPGAIHRYRFGQMQADYIFCNQCGAYIGAVADTDIGTIGFVNVRGVDFDAFHGRDGEQMYFEGETIPERLARRKAGWSPAVLVELRQN